MLSRSLADLTEEKLVGLLAVHEILLSAGFVDGARGFRSLTGLFAPGGILDRNTGDWCSIKVLVSLI